MKSATCILIADTSKFDGPIDSAKSKLSAFGQAVQQSGSLARTALNVWNTAQNVATGINNISTAVSAVRNGMTALKGVGVNTSSVLSRVSSVGKSMGSAFMALPPQVKLLGVAAVGAGAALYGIYKAGQAVVGMVKGVISGVGSIIGRLKAMTASAISGAASLAKVASNAASKGFSAVFGAVGLVTKALGALTIS